MDSIVRSKIKGFLEGFIQGMIAEKTTNGFDPKKLRPSRTSSTKGDLKPFHESLLPDGLLTITEFERSFSTKLGTTFEECARIIALNHHKYAERGHPVHGMVSNAAVKKIESIINKIGTGGMKGKYPDYIQEVIALNNSGKGSERKRIADLYIQTKEGEELFFEIKSPKPNKGQCLEATDRLLQIHAMTYNKHPKVRALYAMAYNPYGLDKKTYKHSFVVNYMDVENEVLIGKEFWDIVGGSGTYEEILDIYQEVGREKGPDMLEQLAMGY